MRIRWLAVVADAVMAVPGTALAHGGWDDAVKSKNASKLCKGLKAEKGAQGFRTAYGSNHNGRNEHGKCVSKHRHFVKQLFAEAVEQCKTEQTARIAFRHGKSGDNKSRSEERRAFHQCVRDKVRAMIAEFQAKADAAV